VIQFRSETGVSKVFPAMLSQLRTLLSPRRLKDGPSLSTLKVKQTNGSELKAKKKASR